MHNILLPNITLGLQHGSYNTPARDYRSIGDAREVETVDRNPYRYKYNDYRENCIAILEDTARSAELQDALGLNVTAMDFRQYDNALGRFLNPDALSELAPMHTPYRFAFNNPIRYSDPLGLFEDDYRLSADATLEKIRNTNSDEENGVHHIYNANETNSIEITTSAIDNKITWDEKSIGVKGASGSSLFFNDTKEANRFYEFTAKSLISSEAGLVEIGNIDSESAQGSIVTINEINRTNGYDQGSEKIGASIISGIIEIPDVKIFRRSHSHFSRSDGSDNSPSGTYYNSDKANPNATTGDTKIHGKRRSQLGDRYPTTSELYVPRINVKIIYDDTGVLKRK
ncbi:hypothetical protein NMK71_01455 [Weeksellaceae bacterium KMM 9713]|uniref:RHS repeat-associated core domain-containing protein n=1 Tax=Profundicola chukchiensis TaxID=2961959 RepID=A0A9X4MUH6_9FLAO|nr:RHS repeat-associated core domain-containing protein [Profundicola chukchiensis]MDG4945068.1 hypothetical protein [Profundicola chukchiensis]